MLVSLLYLSFLVIEGAYPATHWVVNGEGKIQAQASSVDVSKCFSAFYITVANCVLYCECNLLYVLRCV